MSLAHPWTDASSLSLYDSGVTQLRAVCRSLGWDGASIARAADLFARLTEPWGSWPVGAHPPWPSDISDDGTPFELSLAFRGGEPRVRMLVDAQALPVTPRSRWQAAIATQRRLEALGADLARFDRIQDLFVPSGLRDDRFQLWHAVDVDPAGAHLFKAYVDPEVMGRGAAEPLVAEALARLGLPEAAPFLAARLRDRDAGAWLRYFSVDLDGSPQARAKVYLAYTGPAAAIQRQIDGCAGVGAADAETWLGALAGHVGPYDGRPMLVCFGFRADRPVEVTIHVPIRDYVADDAEALARVQPWLTPRDADLLARSVDAIAGRRLDAGRGILAYASLRRRAGGLDVTAYLAPELYGVSPPRPASRATGAEASAPRPARTRRDDRAPARFADVERLISRHQASIARHPFLERLDRETSPARAIEVGRRLGFFVLGFQDVLRVTAELSAGSDLGDLLRVHAGEDAGHERWYLADLAALGAPIDLAWLYAPDHAATRDVTYAILAEVMGARHAATRLAVVLALEACAAEFFPRIQALFERLGQDRTLRYFGALHRRVESEHEVGRAEAQASLLAVALDAEVIAELFPAVDRTFGAMRCLADDIDRALAVTSSPEA